MAAGGCGRAQRRLPLRCRSGRECERYWDCTVMVLLTGSTLVGLSSKVREAGRYRGCGGARGMDLAVVLCCPDMGGGSAGGG